MSRHLENHVFDEIYFLLTYELFSSLLNYQFFLSFEPSKVGIFEY